MRPFKTLPLCVAVLTCVACTEIAYAQAYCALRDPVRTIYTLYPTASSYRSIVATVGEKAREDIARRLHMALHHGELGQHTLYVALEGPMPLGLVHVRAERTQWGLTEIAWAFDLDLRVIDVQVQRSRSPSREFIESWEFRSQVRGKTASTLAAMLVADTGAIDWWQLRVPDRHRPLADAVIRSGLKAIVASESVWGEEIKQIRRLVSSMREPR